MRRRRRKSKTRRRRIDRRRVSGLPSPVGCTGFRLFSPPRLREHEGDGWLVKKIRFYCTHCPCGSGLVLSTTGR
jgi:hypothetical protein